MLEYSEVLFAKFVELLKIIIPLYICFDICGDMLWKRH